MLVGEMPGDREDRAGQPFVGPAGRELDRALEAAGIDRAEVYLTNAVKHFKFEERGKRRIHQTPASGEVDACMPWLRAELDVVRPHGARAARRDGGKALLGESFRLTRCRGRPHRVRPGRARRGHHPPLGDPARRDDRDSVRAAFADDLRMVVAALA